MAFSVSPSVIVREVDASQAVPGVATPPAAMAGVFRWGPTNDPILITSENELVDRFGKPTDNNYETFFTAADYLAYSNALYVVRADDGSDKADSTNIVLDANNDIDVDQTVYGAFEAKYPGDLGNTLEVAWVTSGGFSSNWITVGDISEDELTPTGNTVNQQTIDFNSNEVSFEVANTAQLDALAPGDILVLGNDSVGYQELEVATFAESEVEATFGSGNTAVDAVVSYVYDITFTKRYTLAETLLTKMSMTKKWQHNAVFGTAPDPNHLHIAVIDAGGLISGAENTVLEVFSNVSTTDGAVLPQGNTNYYIDVIENMSSWISVANTMPIGTASTAMASYERFSGGTDATTESNTTLSALAFAYDTLKNTNEIDISSVLGGKADDAGTRANYLISNVVDYRRDCVAYLSPSKEAVVDELKTNAKLTNAIAWRNRIQNSSYWFMDSGYKYRYDKYNDVYRYTPLNGDMAGLAARVDSWESPAGFRKGIIKNVVKLAFNPSKAQRDQLYSADINPVMAQAGRGIVLFGDKTGLGINSAFDRINVRRLFISVEKAIATAAESFLFEFNDEFTQTQFKNIVDPFLRDIQGRRGIIDFRVVSDSTVNTPEVIDQNKFRASIFIKPARSINVIELTFVATRTGVEFDEIVGQLT
jgi:phage tail sheath protein FI